MLVARYGGRSGLRYADLGWDLARDRLKIDVPVVGLQNFFDILARGDV